MKIVAIDTEMQASRERLAHVARVITLGELTASIAHEVNQPLAAVVTNANACSRWLGADPPNLDEATKAIDRIVRDGHPRQRRGRPGPFARQARQTRSGTLANINELIVEVVALTQPDSRRSGISLHTDLADGLPPIAGDRIQLQQVVLNLVMNAIDAIKGGATRPTRCFDRLGAGWRQQHRGDGPGFRHRA